jgi:hypothetical protein
MNAQREEISQAQLNSLREEILQAERVRSDLLKWKLALVGALGAAGLGFAGSDGPAGAVLVLCLVPLVCLYVDLLCSHLSLRILVIGSFIQTRLPDEGGEEALLAAYEEHASRARKLPRACPLPAVWFDRAVGRLRRSTWRQPSAFDLEDWALSWSTGTLSLFALAYAIVWMTERCVIFGLAFLLSGAIGITVTVVATTVYRDRFRAVEELAQTASKRADPDHRYTVRR